MQQVQGLHTAKLQKDPLLQGGTVILSDLHVGARFSTAEQDQHLAATKIGQTQPDNIIINGDLVDNGGPLNRPTQETARKAADIVKYMANKANTAKIWLTRGNHDVTEELNTTINTKILEDPKAEDSYKGYHIIDKILVIHGDTITSGNGEENTPTLNKRDLIKQETQQTSVSWRSRAGKQEIVSDGIKQALSFLPEFVNTQFLGRASAAKYPRDELIKNTFAAIKTDAPQLLDEITDIVIGHVHRPKSEINIPFKYENNKTYHVHITGASVKGSQASILHLKDSSSVKEGEARATDLAQSQSLEK